MRKAYLSRHHHESMQYAEKHPFKCAAFLWLDKKVEVSVAGPFRPYVFSTIASKWKKSPGYKHGKRSPRDLADWLTDPYRVESSFHDQGSWRIEDIRKVCDNVRRETGR